MIKNEEEAIARDEEQKTSVAASLSFLIFTAVLNPLPHPPHCLRPVLLRYALASPPSEVLPHAALSLLSSMCFPLC